MCDFLNRDKYLPTNFFQPCVFNPKKWQLVLLIIYRLAIGIFGFVNMITYIVEYEFLFMIKFLSNWGYGLVIFCPLLSALASILILFGIKTRWVQTPIIILYGLGIMISCVATLMFWGVIFKG